MSELGIAIPFYSGLAYLRRAIQSLLGQSTEQWHAIVVDDAGPDSEARDVIREFSDTRIRYVRNQSNLGLARNWNLCLELVDSELVTLFHADDELSANYVQATLDAHLRHPEAAAVHTRAIVIGSRSTPIFSFPDVVKEFIAPSGSVDQITTGDAGLATVLRGQFIFCPALSYKTRLLPGVPFDEAWRQVLDLDLVARLLFDGHTIVGGPERAYRYRRHRASQTTLLTSSRERFLEEFALYGSIARRAEAMNWERTAVVARRARIVRAHVFYRALGRALQGHVQEARSTVALLGARR